MRERICCSHVWPWEIKLRTMWSEQFLIRIWVSNRVIGCHLKSSGVIERGKKSERKNMLLLCLALGDKTLHNVVRTVFNSNLGVKQSYLVSLGVFRCHRVSPGVISCHWKSLSVTGCHRVSPVSSGVTRCHRLSPGVIGCHQVSLGIKEYPWVSWSVISRHWLSPGVNGHHGVSTGV